MIPYLESGIFLDITILSDKKGFGEIPTYAFPKFIILPALPLLPCQRQDSKLFVYLV